MFDESVAIWPISCIIWPLSKGVYWAVTIFIYYYKILISYTYENYYCNKKTISKTKQGRTNSWVSNSKLIHEELANLTSRFDKSCGEKW